MCVVGGGGGACELRWKRKTLQMQGQEPAAKMPGCKTQMKYIRKGGWGGGGGGGGKRRRMILFREYKVEIRELRTWYLHDGEGGGKHR